MKEDGITWADKVEHRGPTNSEVVLPYRRLQGFPELDIPYLERKKFHGLFRNNKVLICLLFLTKIDVAKFHLEFSTDPGTVWRWVVDDLDLLSRNPKVHAPARPWILSPLFDSNSATSMDSHCARDLDLAFGTL